MFVIATSETYPTIVRVPLIDAKGNTKTHTFKAFWKRLPQDEIDRLNERLQKGDISDQQVIDEYMTGWDDVKDNGGQPVEFNETNLAALLLIHPTRSCLAKSFADSIYGAVGKN